MANFIERRLQNLQENKAILEGFGLNKHKLGPKELPPKSKATASGIVARVRKPKGHGSSRASPRIAAVANTLQAETRTRSTRTSAGATAFHKDYEESDTASDELAISRKKSSNQTREATTQSAAPVTPESDIEDDGADADAIKAGWTAWESVAAPTRDASGTYHFESHPDFTPNKSPEEIIREGCFGGSYWRPLYSKQLKTTIEGDWRELPVEWTQSLDIGAYLTNPNYYPEINKYGVACGQSIEQWEAAGWIAHKYDVRGWFQWYCRFWMGRRCDDDERQISRWKKCVGTTGRWRRTLLKKYVAKGIRSVFDEGDDVDEERGDVSPVVHQTCHHWAYEVRQEALDRFWAEVT